MTNNATCRDCRSKILLFEGNYISEVEFCSFHRSRLEAVEKLGEALDYLMPLAELGLPRRPHEGSCGPEAGCDGHCMDFAAASMLLGNARAALALLRVKEGEKSL